MSSSVKVEVCNVFFIRGFNKETIFYLQKILFKQCRSSDQVQFLRALPHLLCQSAVLFRK
jgi:hypothetical protein